MGRSLPKQYLPLCGRTMLEWSLEALLQARWIRRVVVVLAAGDRRFARLPVATHPRVLTAAGGSSRAQSVAAGLTALMEAGAVAPKSFVLVHDAARPCLAASDLQRLRDAASDRNGGLLARPATDTLKLAQGQRAVATLDRSRVWQAQTPQMFRLDLLARALDRAARAGHEITDEAAAMQLAGFRPQLVEASAGNLKVTFPVDLQDAEVRLARRKRRK
jgi:2-C-methyl-D-erythritol 4-phosphate cytidylyltransferase